MLRSVLSNRTAFGAAAAACRQQSRSARDAARWTRPMRLFSAAAPQPDSGGELLYKVDRKNRFRALTLFSTCQFAYFGSLAWFKMANLLEVDPESAAVDAVIGASAPVCAAGVVCSLACFAMTHIYASKYVSMVLLSPDQSRVMVATYDLIGRRVPRELAVSDFTSEPASSSYYIFKMEDDKYMSVIDRDVGEFPNQSKLERLLQGRMHGTTRARAVPLSQTAAVSPPPTSKYQRKMANRRRKN